MMPRAGDSFCEDKQQVLPGHPELLKGLVQEFYDS
jgi:hypothetical protein